MSTRTEIPLGEPTIVMTRIYDAALEMVWGAMTEPAQVRQWWGGPGCSNPVCEMVVRPGGAWKHVLRFPDGREMNLDFVFLEVERPRRLAWRHADHDERAAGTPAPQFTTTLEDLGDRTRCTMVARFRSIAERDAAVSFGFTGPIEGSNNRLSDYLKTIRQGSRG